MKEKNKEGISPDLSWLKLIKSELVYYTWLIVKKKQKKPKNTRQKKQNIKKMTI